MKECIIQGRDIQSWESLYKQFALDLSFPDWFGSNLDALYDCLTELDDAQITIYHWEALTKTLGAKAKGLKQVLSDAGLENPNLIVCILEEADDEI